MTIGVQSSFRNTVLGAMAAKDFALLGCHLEPFALEIHASLAVPGQKLSHIVFPEQGLASVVAVTRAGRSTEVGVIGHEGLVDICFVNDADVPSLGCFVQIAGFGHRLPVAVFRKALDRSPTLRTLASHYAQSFLMQVSHSALAYAAHTIGERLARWLLMAQDRIGQPDVIMTHESLSIMLGVRRAGVTIALQEIEGQGIVRARRGSITIIDRTRLEGLAAGSYGAAEAEYQRLLGVDFRN